MLLVNMWVGISFENEELRQASECTCKAGGSTVAAAALPAEVLQLSLRLSMKEHLGGRCGSACDAGCIIGDVSTRFPADAHCTSSDAAYGRSNLVSSTRCSRPLGVCEINNCRGHCVGGPTDPVLANVHCTARACLIKAEKISIQQSQPCMLYVLRLTAWLRRSSMSQPSSSNAASKSVYHWHLSKAENLTHASSRHMPKQSQATSPPESVGHSTTITMHEVKWIYL